MHPEFYAIIGASIAILGFLYKLRADALSAKQGETDLIDSMITRLVILETHDKLLWAVVEHRAVDILHHPGQPLFDSLLDKAQQNKLTDAERDQYIDRLEVLADKGEPAQVAAANLLILTAIKQREARKDFPAQTTNLSTAQQREVNREVKTATAAESDTVTAKAETVQAEEQYKSKDLGLLEPLTVEQRRLTQAQEQMAVEHSEAEIDLEEQIKKAKE